MQKITLGTVLLQSLSLLLLRFYTPKKCPFSNLENHCVLYFALFLTFSAVGTTDNCKLPFCWYTTIKKEKRPKKFHFEAGIMTLPKTFIGSYFVLAVWHRQPHIGKEADWISPLTAVEEAAAACSSTTSEGWFDWIEVQKLKLCNLRSDRAKNFFNLRTRGTLELVVVVIVVGKRLLKVNSFCPSFSVSLEPRLAAFNHSMVQSFCMRAKKRQCYCKLLSLFAKA